MTVCLPTVRLSLRLCICWYMCWHILYLRLSQIELLSISEDTCDSETIITCKGRNSRWRPFVCAETFVDLDTVARWRDGRNGTFLNVIMHAVHVHYTSPGRQDGLHVSHISMQLASSRSVISPVAQNGKPKEAPSCFLGHTKRNPSCWHSQQIVGYLCTSGSLQSHFVKQRFAVLAVS